MEHDNQATSNCGPAHKLTLLNKTGLKHKQRNWYAITGIRNLYTIAKRDINRDAM